MKSNHICLGHGELMRRLAVAAVVVGAACESGSQRAAGPAPAAQVQSPPIDRPFYYYQGSPIYLKPDPQRLVVASQDPAVAATLTDALTRLGVPVNNVESLPQAPGHWLIDLRQGTSATTADDAVGRVKADSRFVFASTAFRTVEGNADITLLNRLVVRFRPGVSKAAIDSLNVALGTRVIRPPRPDSGFAEWWLAYPRGATVDPLRIAAAYDRHPLVLWADPDHLSDAHFDATPPNDPLFSGQYYLRNGTVLNGVPVDINVLRAWDLTLGGGVPSSGGITVAVIDMGVQASHEDFGGRVQFGYDVFGNNTYGCTDCATSPLSTDTHGQQVAGIVGATQNNGVGISGVAPAVWILPVRIYRGGVWATACQIGDGINYAWNLAAADVLSNSWGTNTPDNCISNAVNNAATQGRGGRGALVVFSAGNTSNRDGNFIGAPSWTAQLPNVLAVGAIDRNGALTNYTPEGSAIAVVAPSSHYAAVCAGDVVTTYLMGPAPCGGANRNYTPAFGGTSAAAPQVAAVGALLYSREGGLTAAQARARIRANADVWGPMTQYGAGKLNAYHTLVPPPNVSIYGPTTIVEYTSDTWSAVVSAGTPPYTYQWTVDGAAAGTSTSITAGSSWAGGTGHPISLTVTDARSDQGSNSLTVYVTYSSCPTCLRPGP